MTQPCRLAEWTTRLKGYRPQRKTPAGTVGQRIDYAARPLASRWIYALQQRTDVGGGFEIPFEGYVDDGGWVWFAADSAPPSAPIPERADPRDGVGDSHFHFPMVNGAGQALSTRLLCSPFRLPSATVGMLARAETHEAIVKTIPPLWSWESGASPDSPIHSTDGYSLKIAPLWMKLGRGTAPEPVLVGSDPFAIAERRSNLFVKKRRAYAEIYEPRQRDKQQELARISLGQAINDAIAAQPEARDRYGKSIDIARMNRELGAFEERQTKLRRAYERSAKMLCNHLLSPLFALLQYSSLEEEGFDAELGYSEGLAEHMKVLEHVTRQLDHCKAGYDGKGITSGKLARVP